MSTESEVTTNNNSNTNTTTKTNTTDLSNTEVDGDNNNNSQDTQELESYLYNLTIHTPRGAKIQVQLSPLDSVQELRQNLFDASETCDLTSYTLTFKPEGEKSGVNNNKDVNKDNNNNTPLNELVELAEIPGLKQDSELVMTFETYSERSILMHIRRLREITSAYLWDLSNSPSPSLFSYVIPPSSRDFNQHEASNESNGSNGNEAGAATNKTEKTATNGSNGSKKKKNKKANNNNNNQSKSKHCC